MDVQGILLLLLLFGVREVGSQERSAILKTFALGMISDELRCSVVCLLRAFALECL